MKFVQSCVLFFIIYTILLEMVPGDSFRKYMKLMGGFVFLLLFMQGLFGIEHTLPVMLKNYYERLEADSKQSSDKRKIVDEYEKQIEEQIKYYLEQDGFDTKSADVIVKDQEIDTVRVKLNQGDQMDIIEIKNKISKVYSVDVSHIYVKV